MPRTRTYGLDVDTIAFAARVKAGSGKTILPENLKQINKFVVGVKKLGLWNSMVCWPMRSIHNAGTATTVYSLGGLGTYNGTMVNSPTWGYNGIYIYGSTGTSSSVQATVGNLVLTEQSLYNISRPIIGGQSYVAIARNSTGGTQNGMTLRANESNSNGGDMASIQQVLGSIQTNYLTQNSNSTTLFFGRIICANTNTYMLKRFPSTIDTNNLGFPGSNLTNTDPLYIGRRSASASLDNEQSFSAMFIKDIRNQMDEFNKLVTRTLGQNLQLPYQP
jgi:hypothetical protein